MAPTPAPPPAIPSFTPVPRKVARVDGWTPVRQKRFIAALAAMGSVTRAAEAVGMSYSSAYALRVAPGAASFAEAWDAALERGADRVYDVLMDQAVHGVPEPIMYGGQQVAERRRFNHRTMMWVVEHNRGGAHRIRERRVAAGTYPPGQQPMRGQSLKDELEAKLMAIHHRMMDDLADDPAKRAAYELLNGPTDWSRYDDAAQAGGTGSAAGD